MFVNLLLCPLTNYSVSHDRLTDLWGFHCNLQFPYLLLLSVNLSEESQDPSHHGVGTVNSILSLSSFLRPISLPASTCHSVTPLSVHHAPFWCLRSPIMTRGWGEKLLQHQSSLPVTFQQSSLSCHIPQYQRVFLSISDYDADLWCSAPEATYWSLYSFFSLSTCFWFIIIVHVLYIFYCSFPFISDYTTPFILRLGRSPVRISPGHFDCR